MKIRIIQCSNPRFWYANRIDETFEVVTNGSSRSYHVFDDDYESLVHRVILEKDVRIVEIEDVSFRPVDSSLKLVTTPEDFHNKTYLNGANAAKYLGISYPNLISFVRKGLIPSYKVGGSVRYRRAELDTVVDRGFRDFTGKGKPFP